MIININDDSKLALVFYNKIILLQLLLNKFKTFDQPTK